MMNAECRRMANAECRMPNGRETEAFLGHGSRASGPLPRIRRSAFGIRHSAFTLIELLTVIAIIGVLAGLLLGAVSAARVKARRVRVETEVRELAKAWKSYWVTYGRQLGWPEVTDGQGSVVRYMNRDMVGVLAGKDAKWNPQGIVFMEVDAEDLAGGFKDPWGNYYWVDFSSDLITGVEEYETTVSFPNRKRYAFE